MAHVLLYVTILAHKVQAATLLVQPLFPIQSLSTSGAQDLRHREAIFGACALGGWGQLNR